jgi:hypothetical protein
METLPNIVHTFKKLNAKFFNSRFCPQWVIHNKTCLGDAVDIKTQCYVTAYALMYLLTGSAEEGWVEVKKDEIDHQMPILIAVDTDQHMMVYYDHCLYESFHLIHKLKISENIQLNEIIEHKDIFLKNRYGQYGIFTNLTYYQKKTDLSVMNLDQVRKRYLFLSNQYLCH